MYVTDHLIVTLLEAEGINIAVTRESCLSPQVYDLVTRRDHVTQPVDYLDNHYTIDLTVMQQQFGAGVELQMCKCPVVMTIHIVLLQSSNRGYTGYTFMKNSIPCY